MTSTPARVFREWQRKRCNGPRTYSHTPRRYRLDARIYLGRSEPDEGQEA